MNVTVSSERQEVGWAQSELRGQEGLGSQHVAAWTEVPRGGAGQRQDTGTGSQGMSSRGPTREQQAPEDISGDRWGDSTTSLQGVGQECPC